jgi:hypothetical protein
MFRRLRFSWIALGLGASVLALGSTAQPATAGIIQITCQKGPCVGLAPAQPGNFVMAGSSNLVPAGQSSAGFFVPSTVGSWSSYSVPTYTTANYLPATGSYYMPTASFSSGIAGFSLDDTAAYNSSPNLATYLGGNFGRFRQGLLAHANIQRQNGVTGTDLIQSLRDLATKVLIPALAPILGDVTSNIPVVSEIEKIIQGVVGSPGVSAPVGAAGGAGTIVINVTCDGKTTTTTIDRQGRKVPADPAATGRPPVRPGHDPGTRPAPLGGDSLPLPGANEQVPEPAADASDTLQRLNDAAASLQRVSYSLERAARNLEAKSRPVQTQTQPAATKEASAATKAAPDAATKKAE